MVSVEQAKTAGGGPSHALPPVLAAMRPDQWIKNLLVLAVPVAAGEIAQLDVLLASAIAFAAFCLAASAGYLLNDVLDLEADRAHPRKRLRPVASGRLRPATALGAAAVLALASVGVSTLASPSLVVAVVTYLLITGSYSLGLKHQPVVDLALITGAFLVRAVAGGAAAELPVSQWFLIVSAFAALFLVTGKRYSELLLLGDEAVAARPSLAGYTASYLRFLSGVAAAVAITAYCLWAFEVGGRTGYTTAPWAQLSVVPFVVGLLRYARDIDAGTAGAPEEIALRDHVLQALALTWLVLFSLGAFGV